MQAYKRKWLLYFSCCLGWNLFKLKKNKTKKLSKMSALQASCHSNISSGLSALISSGFLCFLSVKHLKREYLKQIDQGNPVLCGTDPRAQFWCLQGTQNKTTTETPRALGRCKESGNNLAILTRVCIHSCNQQGLRMKEKKFSTLLNGYTAGKALNLPIPSTCGF